MLSTTSCTGPATARSETAPTDATVTSVAAWVARSLPDGAVITADASSTRAALAGAGVVAGLGLGSPLPATADRYLVTTSARATTATRELSPDLTAVPVARFGAAGSWWSVDRVIDEPVATVAGRADRATSDRRTAGSALTTNPAVTVCTSCDALRDGGLDLRAAAFLAVLAAAGPVVVRQIVSDPAEAAAGQPARQITLGAVSPATVRELAGGTVGLYRPTITAVTSTTTTLTWSLADPMTLTGA